MKKIIASMLIVASMFTSTAFALDMPDTVTGYIGGYPDGTVRPDATITRAEMAQIVTNIMHFTNPVTGEAGLGNSPYGDVINNYEHTNWYFDAVCAANQYNLFTTVSYPRVQEIYHDYPMKDLVRGIYKSLNMANFDYGPYKLHSNDFTKTIPEEDKVMYDKLCSWGLDSRAEDWEMNKMGDYSTAMRAYSEITSYIKDMLILLYPDGVSASELGDPGFYTGATETHGVKWREAVLFRPEDNMTREEMALVLYRMTDKDASNTATYSDISNLKQESKDAIGYLSSKGVITGYPDGTFKPKAAVTRAEAIVMINRFFGDKVVASNSTFNPKDLNGHWAEPQIRKVLKNTEPSKEEPKQEDSGLDWFTGHTTK